MEKIVLVFGVLTVLFYSCEKIEDIESTQATKDHLFAEQTFSDVGRIVEGAFLANGINKSYPKYTILDTDSSTADTLVINFGPENILFPNPGGKLRKGAINITYTGKYRDSLAVITATFNNYYVNSNLIQGERIVANQGRNKQGNMWFTIDVIGSVRSINWNAKLTREWVSGNATYYDISDDQYKITGTASGNAANGNDFTMEITETLNVDLGCLPSCVIKSGKAKITPNGYADRIINYGDSLCDCNFDVKINGNTYPIVVN